MNVGAVYCNHSWTIELYTTAGMVRIRLIQNLRRNIAAWSIPCPWAWSVSGGPHMFGVIGIVHRHVVADVSSHQSCPTQVARSKQDPERADVGCAVTGVVGVASGDRECRVCFSSSVVVERAFANEAGVGGHRRLRVWEWS